jgi:transcription initiation factor TFIID TATA-box-binding protein
MPRPISVFPFRIGARLLWSVRNNGARASRDDLVSFPLALLVANDDICGRGFCRPLGSRIQTLNSLQNNIKNEFEDDKLPVLKIQNLIQTFDLKQSVNVRKFGLYDWGTYDLARYQGRCGYIKDASMEGRVSVFFSGKMISTGGKSLEHSEYQLRHSIELMSKAGLVRNGKSISKNIDPKVQNIVAVEDFGRRIHLNKLSQMLFDSMLEPEIFPGLMHKTKFGTTCLVFESGKMVITGGKTVEQIEKTVSSLRQVIESSNLFT